MVCVHALECMLHEAVCVLVACATIVQLQAASAGLGGYTEA